MINEFGKEFVPFEYTDNIVIRVLIKSVFGQKIEFNSPAVNRIKETFEAFQENSLKIIGGYYFPALKLFHRKSSQNKITKQSNIMFRHWISENTKSYDDDYNHLSDLIHSAKSKFLKDNKDKYNEQYLCESNVVGTVCTVYFGKLFSNFLIYFN
jgi:hypothetical protein